VQSKVAADGSELLRREPCIIVHISGITAALSNFKFKVNKKSFPSICDKGQASGKVTFTAQIKFSLEPDTDGSVSVTSATNTFLLAPGSCSASTA
jgi:hypothetical protein